MDQKTWGPFSGTQLTILLTAAILAFVPTALWSVATYTQVAIQDPLTGSRAAVDSHRRLQISAVDDMPANFVHKFITGTSGCTPVYTIPAGKALILKSMHAYLFKVNLANSDLQTIIFNNATCTGDPLGGIVSGGAVSQESKAVDFGSGVAIPAGHTLALSDLNNAGTANIYGYLVPAGWVPASASASAPANATGPKQGANPLKRGARQ